MSALWHKSSVAAWWGALSCHRSSDAGLTRAGLCGLLDGYKRMRLRKLICQDQNAKSAVAEGATPVCGAAVEEPLSSYDITGSK